MKRTTLPSAKQVCEAFGFDHGVLGNWKRAGILAESRPGRGGLDPHSGFVVVLAFHLRAIGIPLTECDRIAREVWATWTSDLGLMVIKSECDYVFLPREDALSFIPGQITVRVIDIEAIADRLHAVYLPN